tara:strand:- start:1101 stop:2090 length:990 start_codon:yes stop_codon:yes gene_type:complete
MVLISKLVRKILKSFLSFFVRKSLFDFSSQKKLIDISNSELSKEETNKKIGEMILNEKPFLVGRFGWTELDVLIRFERYSKMNTIEKIFEWSRLNIYPFSKKCLLYEIHTKAGFYPVNKYSLEKFREIMIKTMPEIDILGSWLDGESNYIQFMKNIEFCKLEFLEPYFCKNPWSKNLKNKKVLVIHPFTETIKKQYELNREKIFLNKDVLPEFDLRLMKTTFTNKGAQVKHKDWFEKLESMFIEAISFEFDIAIIGCGSYGLPLAAKLKSYGKQAIHLGGATQLLFGIKGKRWAENPSFYKLFNNFWVYPSIDELPKTAVQIDNACYWK